MDTAVSTTRSIEMEMAGASSTDGYSQEIWHAVTGPSLYPSANDDDLVDKDFDAFLSSMLMAPEPGAPSVHRSIPLHDDLLEQLAKELESTIELANTQSSTSNYGMETLEDAGFSPLDQCRQRLSFS